MEVSRPQPTRMTAEEFRAYSAGRRAEPKPRRRRAAPANGSAVQSHPFRLTLPFLPPSVNQLFTTVRDPDTGTVKRVLTSNARRVRRLIQAMISTLMDPALTYEMRVDIHLRTHTRNGNVRKIDLTNRVKFLEDCVCEALGIDDSHVFRVVLQKHDSIDESTVITLSPFTPA